MKNMHASESNSEDLFEVEAIKRGVGILSKAIRTKCKQSSVLGVSAREANEDLLKVQAIKKVVGILAKAIQTKCAQSSVPEVSASAEFA